MNTGALKETKYISMDIVKAQSVHSGTRDLLKQLYANLHIFECKREDLKTSVFRGSLLSSHIADFNSHIAESEFKIL